MKKLFLSLGLALTMGGAAFAQTPPEVLKLYKSYSAALKSGDQTSARKFAYASWKKAEDLAGDSKLTSDLAVNYAMMDAPKNKANTKLRKQAFERSLELASFYGADAAITYLERASELMTFYQGSNDIPAAFKTAKSISNYAEENNLTRSTFYAEALTNQAGYYAAKGKNKDATQVAEKALAAFENADDGIVSYQPILANLYRGYGLEAEKDTVEAALSYQKVMEALDGVQPDEHPLAAKALGRWSHMRSVLKTEGKLEEAEAKGLCKCWPYDKPRSESLKPIKRVPPKMPSNAYVSGFSIVQFDLDDAGKPTNSEILVSWPKEIYEKASLKSLSGWEYTARTADETDSDRQELVTTIRYKLTDRNGNLLY